MPSRAPLDTDPEAYSVQIEAYRRMGGARRTAVVFRLNQLARQMAEARIVRRLESLEIRYMVTGSPSSGSSTSGGA